MQKTVLGFMVFAGMLGMGLGADANVAGASAIPPVVSAAHPANVSDPALSKQRYDMIMSQLDAGGDLLVVANLEGLVKGAVAACITTSCSVNPVSSPNSRIAQTRSFSLSLLRPLGKPHSGSSRRLS